MLDLLAMLTEEPESGEALAERAGVSRVAVSKAAHRLAEQGFPVSVSKSGYALEPGAPTVSAVAALVRGRIGADYRYLGTVGSTQDEVRALAAAGAAHGTVVLAERQHHGRGRYDRSWSSSPGKSLTFSVLLRPSAALSALPLVSIAAGVALAEACGVGDLRWPNDLLAPDGRKLAGVLSEARTVGESIDYVSLGIGVNVYPPAPEGGAALAESGSFSRVETLVAIFASLDRWLDESVAPADLLAAWRSHSSMLGKRVVVRTPDEVRGVAVDLDDSGGLILESRGKRTHVAAGDVELIRTEERKRR